MLKISNDLSIPLSAVTQKIVVYGSPNMGKTNFGSVMAEELYANHLRFSVIDPMGVWWGIQHGASGKQTGLEVLILGGIHGDLPIEPTAGDVVADLVADESVSVIIDISRTSAGKAWSKGQKIRFVRDYMIRLYERQVEHRRPILQIIDEAARYAPQTIMSGDKDAAACLGAIEMVCEEGRNLGIGVMLLTQRSARLSKSVAELSETMFSFRVVGPNSVAAVVDWFGEHVPKEQHKQLVSELRTLPQGKALLVSPGWLEYEGSIQIRLRTTFDSSKTPEHGDVVAPGKAQKPDLEKYRTRMAETIEKATAEDPKILKAEIAKLKTQIAAAAAIPAAPETITETVTVEVFPKDLETIILSRLENLERSADQVEYQAKRFVADVKEKVEVISTVIRAAIEKEPAKVPAKASPSVVNASPKPLPQKSERNMIKSIPASVTPGELSPLHRSILDGAALLHSIGLPNPSIAQVGAVIGKYHNSGRIRGGFNQTHSMGYAVIDNDLNISLTPAGHSEAEIPNIHSRADIHNLWFGRLKGNELSFLRALIKEYPLSLTLTELGKKIGKDINSGRVRGALNDLVDKGLAAISGDDVRVADVLFPEGLR
ncbi:MAG: hypothetical protein ABL984_05370 [Pyrinomonadaceae bacterium]